MKYRQATDIVSVMYKYAYIVYYKLYFFLGNGEYMEFNKLASSCIKFKFCRTKPQLDLTRFNKIATQGAPQMAVDKEANSLSRVYSYYSKFNLCLFYV